MVLLQEKNVNKPGKFTTAVVVDTHARPDGTVSRFLLKTAGNKNPILRDSRQVYLTEHTYLSLTDENHQCLVKGRSSPMARPSDQGGTGNDMGNTNVDDSGSVISVPLSALTATSGDVDAVGRMRKAEQSARFHVARKANS